MPFERIYRDIPPTRPWMESLTNQILAALADGKPHVIEVEDEDQKFFAEHGAKSIVGPSENAALLTFVVRKKKLGMQQRRPKGRFFVRLKP